MKGLNICLIKFNCILSSFPERKVFNKLSLIKGNNSSSLTYQGWKREEGRTADIKGQLKLTRKAVREEPQYICISLKQIF